MPSTHPTCTSKKIGRRPDIIRTKQCIGRRPAVQPMADRFQRRPPCQKSRGGSQVMRWSPADSSYTLAKRQSQNRAASRFPPPGLRLTSNVCARPTCTSDRPVEVKNVNSKYKSHRRPNCLENASRRPMSTAACPGAGWSPAARQPILRKTWRLRRRPGLGICDHSINVSLGNVNRPDIGSTYILFILL